jgi:hypothetical protein
MLQANLFRNKLKTNLINRKAELGLQGGRLWVVFLIRVRKLDNSTYFSQISLTLTGR